MVPRLLALASWRPRAKEQKASQFVTYAELVRSIFTEKPEKSDEKSAAEKISAAADAAAEIASAAGGDKA